MKLKAFKIENVMSIKDSGKCFLSDRITILAGQNEAGKTAILKSLDYFKNGASDKFKKYATRIGEEPTVTCFFEILPTDLESKEELVVDILKSLKMVALYRKGKDGNEYYYDEGTLSRINEEIVKKFPEPQPNPETDDPVLKPTHKAREASIKNLHKKVEQHIKDCVPEIIYYDSFNDLLPDSITADTLKSNKAVSDLEKVLDVNLQSLKNQQDERIWTTTIRQKTTAFKASFNHYWKQTFLTEKEQDYSILIQKDGNNITFMIDQGNDEPLYLIQKSKGFQWFNSFYLRLKSLEISPEKLSNYLLLIDEPGQGLHETAQEDVRGVLEDLAAKGLNVIYSTHQPLLIDVENHIDRIRLVYKGKEEYTKVNTLAQFVSMASDGKAQVDYTLSPIKSAMGMKQIKIENSGTNVVLEGITDKYYLDAFKLLLDIRDDIHFIPAPGSDGIKNIVSVLLGWGYPFKIVFDHKQTTLSSLKKNFYAAEETDTLFISQVKMLDEKGIEDLFSKKYFQEHLLNIGNPDTPRKVDDIKSNSEIAKDNKKEVLARLFLQDVRSKKIKADQIDKDSKENFKKIFDWILSK